MSVSSADSSPFFSAMNDPLILHFAHRLRIYFDTEESSFEGRSIRPIYLIYTEAQRQISQATQKIDKAKKQIVDLTKSHKLCESKLQKTTVQRMAHEISIANRNLFPPNDRDAAILKRFSDCIAEFRRVRKEIEIKIKLLRFRIKELKNGSELTRLNRDIAFYSYCRSYISNYSTPAAYQPSIFFQWEYVLFNDMVHQPTSNAESSSSSSSAMPTRIQLAPNLAIEMPKAS